MNLTKEQLKQGFLGLIMVGLALYAYATMLLGPLSQQEARAKRNMEELEPKISQANIQINRTRTIEAGDPHGERAKLVRQVIEEQVPRKAAIVWLPHQVVDLFRQYEVEGVSVASRTATSDQELAGFLRSQWVVTIPSVRFHDFAQAVAGLENQFGLAEIQQIELRATPSNMEQQAASLTFSTVTRP